MRIINHIQITLNNPKIAKIQFTDETTAKRFQAHFYSKGVYTSSYGSSISFTAMDPNMIGYVLNTLCEIVEQEDRQLIENAASTNAIDLDPHFKLPAFYAAYNDTYLQFTDTNSKIYSLQLDSFDNGEIDIYVTTNGIESTNLLKQALITQGLPIDISTNEVMLAFSNYNRKHIAHYIHTLAKVCPTIELLYPMLTAKFNLDFTANFKVHTWVATGRANEQSVSITLYSSLAENWRIENIALTSSLGHPTFINIRLRPGFKFPDLKQENLPQVIVRNYGTYVTFIPKSHDMESLMTLLALARCLVGSDYDEIEAPIKHILTLTERNQRLEATADKEPDFEEIIAAFDRLTLRDNVSLKRYLTDLISGIREIAPVVETFPGLTLHNKKRTEVETSNAANSNNNNDDDNDNFEREIQQKRNKTRRS